MPPSSEPAESRNSLSVRDLSFSYGRAPTIVGFKWELGAGVLAALYGPSGAGKSTLLALMAGALPRAGGAVDVCGRDPATPAGRHRLGFMPQVGGLHPGYTIEENLRAFAAGAGRVPRDEVDAAVERTLATIQLTPRRHDVVEHLSAGVQQRVSFGAAMLWNPEVLLLDEPFSMADDGWARTGWEHLRGLAGRGHIVIVATGQAKDALRCERLALVRAGRLLQEGPTAQLVPPGKARVALRYVQKTGPLTEEVEVENVATDLPRLLELKPNLKPVAIDIRPDAAEARLAALLEA